jgi:putative endonuclease
LSLITARLGELGEQIAALFLEAQGYDCVTRRYRRQGGEIDLIMRKQQRLIFVEVKTRRGNRFGRPEEAVNGRKQARLRRLAGQYLHETGPVGIREYRFDVVAVQIFAEGDGCRLRHLCGVV